MKKSARILLIDGRFGEIDLIIENTERIARTQDLTHHINKVQLFKRGIHSSSLKKNLYPISLIFLKILLMDTHNREIIKKH